MNIIIVKINGEAIEVHAEKPDEIFVLVLSENKPISSDDYLKRGKVWGSGARKIHQYNLIPPRIMA